MVDLRRLTTRQKLYGGALAVAFAALVYDQCHGGGPARARATAVIPPVAPLPHVAIDPATALATPAVAAAAPVEPVTPTTADLARRLRTLAGGADPLSDLRDAFAPSDGWTAERRAAAADVAAYLSPEAFAAGHRLSVVLLPNGRGDPTGAAVVGGRLVRVGQAIDGYRLVGVTPRSARLAGAGGSVELRMP